MAATIGTLSYAITADTSGLQKGLKQSNEAVKRTGKEMEKTAKAQRRLAGSRGGGAFARLGKQARAASIQVQRLGLRLGRLAASPLGTAAINAATAAWKSYEKALQEVTASIGKTEKSLLQFQREAAATGVFFDTEELRNMQREAKKSAEEADRASLRWQAFAVNYRRAFRTTTGRAIGALTAGAPGNPFENMADLFNQVFVGGQPTKFTESPTPFEGPGLSRGDLWRAVDSAYASANRRRDQTGFEDRMRDSMVDAGEPLGQMFAKEWEAAQKRRDRSEFEQRMRGGFGLDTDMPDLLREFDRANRGRFGFGGGVGAQTGTREAHEIRFRSQQEKLANQERTRAEKAAAEQRKELIAAIKEGNKTEEQLRDEFNLAEGV